jgi:hypothetical protein
VTLNGKCNADAEPPTAAEQFAPRMAPMPGSKVFGGSGSRPRWIA